MRDFASGSSATLIQFAVPSFIRDHNIQRSYINISSDLLGTEINLPDPFFKVKDDPTELSLTFYPPFAGQISSLRFKLGEIFRGKFNLSNEVTEGFIIAGKEKQSISIEKGKISLIGNIKRLDLSIFNSFEKAINTKIVDLDIKKLEINKITLSNFSLPRTLVRSKNSVRFLELLVSNQNLKGSFYLPKIINQAPIIDLDFLNFNFSEFDNSPFADAYGNLLPPLKFKTNSLVINSEKDHNTQKTAERVARMFITEIFSGRYETLPKITSFPNITDYDQLYTTGPIAVRSTCAHHMQPIVGKCYIGVFPGKHVIGLSKFNRIVRWIAQRPQIQEEMTMQIADKLEEVTKAEGIGVVIKAEHMCMTHRGVLEHESDMTTSIVRGKFRDVETIKQEFFTLLQGMKGFTNGSR